MKNNYKLKKKKGSVWTHREGEIIPLVLENMLSPIAQTTHIENVLSIPIKYRSTYDHICVQAYFRFKFGIKLKREEFRGMTYDNYLHFLAGNQKEYTKIDEPFPIDKINFISLNEEFTIEDATSLIEKTITSTESTQVDASIIDNTEAIKNIPNLTKEEIREYLNVLFKDWYPNWEWDYVQSTPDKFINAISNEIVLSNLDKEMIKAF